MKNLTLLLVSLFVLNCSFAQFSNVKDTVFVTIPFNSSQTFSDTIFNFGNTALPIQWNISTSSTIAMGHTGISICAYPGGCYPFNNTVHSETVNTSAALLFLLSWEVDATASVGSTSYVVINTDIDGGKDIVWEVVVADSPLSIEVFDEQSITFYPIPTSDVLNVEIPEINSSKVEIIDVFGNVVNSIDVQNTAKTQISLSNLSAGTYIVCVYDLENNILARSRIIKD